MKTAPEPTPDPELRALLRAAHPDPELPPRFQEGVWRRLERREQPNLILSGFETWLRGWFRPFYAALGLAVVMLAGVGFGIRDTAASHLQSEQARYLAAVSPLHRTP